MKHIRIFETVDAFNEAKDSLIRPNVGLIKDTGNVYVISAEPEVDYSKIAMYFENVGTDDAVISVIKNNNSANTVSLEISTDNKNWETWGSTSTTELSKAIGAGERLYIRNANDVGYVNNSKSYYNYVRSIGANSIIGGNIMSLCYKNFENKYTIEQSYAYCMLFSGMKTLVDASRLVLPATTLANNCYERMFCTCSALTTAPSILPATTLANSCYNQMFDKCISLTTAPELPATTLMESCYYYMFQYCTSLTVAPKLPATTLADYCYYGMFQDCKSLTTAPELPATTLVTYCYGNMFNNCISLTTAPELPATTLAYYCYDGMFSSCSKLNYIKAMFTTTPNYNYTPYWVSGVSSTGTFVKNANATWDVSGDYGIPTGWRVETATAE